MLKLAYFGLMLLKRMTKENDDSYGENKGNKWRGRRDSNSRPPAGQAGVLNNYNTTPGGAACYRETPGDFQAAPRRCLRPFAVAGVFC